MGFTYRTGAYKAAALGLPTRTNRYQQLGVVVSSALGLLFVIQGNMMTLECLCRASRPWAMYTLQSRCPRRSGSSMAGSGPAGSRCAAARTLFLQVFKPLTTVCGPEDPPLPAGCKRLIADCDPKVSSACSLLFLNSRLRPQEVLVPAFWLCSLGTPAFSRRPACCAQGFTNADGSIKTECGIHVAR